MDRLALAAILSVVVGVQAIEAEAVNQSEAARKGLEHLEEKQYTAAIPYLEQAYRREPDQPQLAERLAYAYSMIGKHGEAITVLDELTQRSGEASDYAWELLAHACRQTGQWSRLLNVAEAAVGTNPHSAEAYHAAGFAASQIYGPRSAEARTYYTKYAELNPHPEETAFVNELFPDVTVVPHTASLHGSWTDDTGEVSEKHIDLFIGSLYAEHRMADLELGINVAGLHPEGQQVHTRFEVFFDTDNNIRTGSPVELFSGIDKILHIELAGTFPFNETHGTIRSLLYDVALGTERPLPPAAAAHVYLFADSFSSVEPSESIPIYDAIDQVVPLELLEIRADQIPVGIRATDLDASTTDLAAFVLDYHPRLSPHVKITPSTATLGQQIEYAGRRFTPHRTVRLTIGGVDILREQTDAEGHFLKAAPLPPLRPGDHLLRAIDDHGTFYLTMFRVQAPEG